MSLGCGCHCGCGAPKNPSQNSLGNVSAVPLLSGDAGVAQTIALMRQLIDEGVKNPEINRYAISILQQSGTPQHEPWGEAQTIYEYVKANFRFVNDPVGSDGPKETLRPAVEILRLGAGDCDDFTVLLCSLLGTIGFRTHIVTVASDPRDPSQFTHVYPEVEIDDEWIPVDAARPGAAFGLAPRRVYRSKTWETPEGSSGIGSLKFSLAGYATLRHGLRRTLGQSGNELAQDITAAGTSAADVLLASEAAPTNIYGTVTTSGTPTALSPYGINTMPAGYSINPLTGQLQSAMITSPFGTVSGSGMFLLLGVGLLAFALMMRK